MRRTLVGLCVGFALGSFVSMWFGPDLLAWWTRPPGGGMYANVCMDQVHWATRNLVKMQLIAGGVLAVVCAVIASLFRRKRPASAPPPATGIPAAQAR
jgi:hypothetical protein